MKATRIIVVLLVLSLFVVANTAPAIAEEPPVGGCPDGFHLHSLADHNHGGGEHQHHHVGNDKDQNGDGYICGKHVGKNGNNHVHIDNNVPLNGSE